MTAVLDNFDLSHKPEFERIFHTYHDNQKTATSGNILDMACATSELARRELLNSMDELRQTGHLCDITLIAESKRFPVHRVVLASASPYFRVTIIKLCITHLI